MASSCVQYNAQYKVRTVKSTDKSSILEFCCDNYVGYSFDRYVNDRDTYFFGIEHIPNNKIVAICLYLIIDNNKTLWTFGWNTNKLFSGKGLFQILFEYSMNYMLFNHKQILRIRGTTNTKNNNAHHIFTKHKFTLINPLYLRSYISKKNTNKKYWHKENEIETRIKNSKYFNQTLIKNNFKELNNIDYAFFLIKNKYKCKLLHFDSIIFDLNIDIDSFIFAKKWIISKHANKQLNIYIANNENSLCIYLQDERPNLDLLYIYGKNVIGIYEMLYYMFFKWKNGNKKELFLSFETKWIHKDSQIKKICQGMIARHLANKNILNNKL